MKNVYCQISNESSCAFLSLAPSSSGGLFFFCLGLCLGSARVIVLALTQCLVSSKRRTNLQLSISLPVREEGSNKLILQLGRLERFGFQPPRWHAALQESRSAATLLHNPFCSIERGWNWWGAMTRFFKAASCKLFKHPWDVWISLRSVKLDVPLGFFFFNSFPSERKINEIKFPSPFVF